MPARRSECRNVRPMDPRLNAITASNDARCHVAPTASTGRVTPREAGFAHHHTNT